MRDASYPLDHTGPPFSSSHLLIFTSAHLHIFTHIFSLSLSSFLSPFSLPFLSLAFFIFLSLGRGWCRRGVTKRQPFRTKWGSIVKNWGKIAILLTPFARNEGRCAKTEVKLRFYLSWSNPFTRNEGRSSKTEENCDFTCPGATLSHEMRVDRQKLR